MVNHTLLCWLRAVPTPVLALEVQRGGMPGQPGAYLVCVSLMDHGFLEPGGFQQINKCFHRGVCSRRMLASGRARLNTFSPRTALLKPRCEFPFPLRR